MATAPPPGFEKEPPLQQSQPGSLESLRPPEGFEKEPAPGLLNDPAAAIGTGLVRGGAGLLGMLGDTRNMYNALLEMAGAELTPAEQAPSRLTPTSGDVLGKIEETTGKPIYKPQGWIEEGLAKGGELLPGILAGPGGVVRRGLEHVVAPTIGSEAGRHVAKDTPYEPYAQIAGELIGGATTPTAELIRPPPIGPERQRLADALQQSQPPIEISAGELTDSPPVKYAESEMGGSQLRNLQTRRGQAATRNVMREIGEDSDSASPPVLQRAQRRLGGEFDRLAATTTMPLDAQLQNDLLRHITAFQAGGGVAPGPEATMNLIADLAAQNGGRITGRAYQTIRSRLGELSANAAAPEVRVVSHRLQDALDDAMERHMPQQHVEEWQQTRRQWRNFIAVRDVMGTSGADVAQGLIPLQKLRGAMEANWPDSYAMGRGDYADLARAGQTFMGALPQSGTAPRAAACLIPATIGSALAGGITGGFTGDIGLGSLAGTAGAIAGAAAPSVYGAAIMRPTVQNWIAGRQPGEWTAAMRRQALLQALMAPRLFSEEEPR